MQDCQVTSSEALCTALQHPAVTEDPQTVCCLLQTCRSWRLAVQQAAAGTTVINLPSLHSIAKLSQFAAWIPKHAGMLAEIHLTVPQTESNGLSAENYATAAEQIILLALQNVAAAAAAAASSAAATAAAAAAPQPLRLRVFHADYVSGPGLLTAIPAATLTTLSFGHVGGWPSVSSAAISHALAGLTALRELWLECCFDEGTRLSGHCLQAIARLSCLSALRLAWTAADADMSLLPQQLQSLELSAFCGDRPLQLQHLTDLGALRLHMKGVPAPQSALPLQLTRLAVRIWCEGDELGYEAKALSQAHNLQHLALGSLQQLVHLEVLNGLSEPHLMHRVACLPRLQQVLLIYTNCILAQRAAPGWQHLPQLQAIDIETSTDDGPSMNYEETEEFMQHLGAATTLTSLRITSGVLKGISICMQLTGLQQLRALELSHADGPHCARDALHLRTLTGLTQLVIKGALGVHDVCAVAIASWLRELRHLELCSCSLSTAAALPAIGSLPHLQKLNLDGHRSSNINDGDIMLLSSLSQLQEFSAAETFTAEAIAAFVRLMRGIDTASAQAEAAAHVLFQEYLLEHASEQEELSD